MKFYSIALDGPAGAGKSTIAKEIAKKLQFTYVDTGAMYRAMGLYFLRKGVSPDNTEEISGACDGIDIMIRYEDGVQQVFLNGENVDEYIRTEEVSRMTSATSVVQKVRCKLVELQQKLASTSNVVMDGRDIGTHVLPKADLKIFLTAAVEVRAKRRYLELLQHGDSHTIEEIEQEIRERDERDSNREISPLAQADDAILLDSSFMKPQEVVDRIIELFQGIPRCKLH